MERAIPPVCLTSRISLPTSGQQEPVLPRSCRGRSGCATAPATVCSFLPDLERAFVNPASVFDSPHDVVRHPLLTIDCKREILQRWAWDEYLLDLADAEGMPEGEPSRLDEVRAALRLVNRECSPDPAAPAAFVVPYHWDETALAA